jgi:hypothetical protein
LGRRGREPTDAEVDAVVALYPDGAPGPVIAEALDVTAQRAEQIINEALTKALAIATARGLIGADCFD